MNETADLGDWVFVPDAERGATQYTCDLCFKATDLDAIRAGRGMDLLPFYQNKVDGCRACEACVKRELANK